SMEVHLPPRPGQYQPYAQPSDFRESVPPLDASKSARTVASRARLLLSRLDFFHPFHRSVRHRNLADVLLPSRGAICLPRHERPPVCRVERRIPAESAPPGRALDGPRGLLAHVSRFLSWRLQTPS